ncbi:MAG: DegT/DnrJ/EryC1/StrS family aminotransferase, partial [Nitrospirae bacterium]
FNINPDLIEEAITERTKAILAVHLYGLAAPMDRILEIASRHGLVVIEDCAQAFGASINGKKVGTFGVAGCYSFYPSKNLGGFGDGGMVVTNSDEIASKVRLLRNHASQKSYLHEDIGYNSRLDEIQAALLLVRLKRIDRDNALRAERARYYTKLLGSLVRCPHVPEGYSHVFHQYTIRHPERDRIKEALEAEGISSVVYYPVPMHLQKPLRELGYKEGFLPETERAAREVLSLPMHPFLSQTEQDRICEVIERTLS